MTPKAEAQGPRLDFLRWLLVVIFAVTSIIGNQYYSGSPILYRVIVLLLIAAAAAYVCLQTEKGRLFSIMVKEARGEIRKVIWPTRQETTQITLIVVAVVLVMALLLWGLDSLLGWLVSLIVR